MEFKFMKLFKHISIAVDTTKISFCNINQVSREWKTKIRTWAIMDPPHSVCYLHIQ